MNYSETGTSGVEQGCKTYSRNEKDQGALKLHVGVLRIYTYHCMYILLPEQLTQFNVCILEYLGIQHIKYIKYDD